MAKTLESIVNAGGGGGWTVEELTGSGTWTNPGTIEGGLIYLTACGGGGSGAVITTINTGAGGGGGGACVIDLPVYVGTDNQVYAVGAGGALVAGGVDATGNSGADTDFGDLTLTGGSGGANPAGGNGGTIEDVGLTRKFRSVWDGTEIDLAGLSSATDLVRAGDNFNHYYGGGAGGSEGDQGGAGYRSGGNFGAGPANEGGGGGSLTPGGSAVGSSPDDDGGGGGAGGNGDADTDSQKGGNGTIIIRYILA